MKKRKGSHGKQSRASREKIKAGVSRYWKRVRRLKKKAAVTLKRARRLYGAGLGRPKAERKKRRHRIKETGILWTGQEFLLSFEENWRGRLAKSVPKRERRYVADVVFRFEGEEEEETYDDEIEWTSAGESAFWSEYWIAAKDWLRLLVEQFEPESMHKTEDGSPPANGSAEILKIVMGKPE